MVRNRRMIVLSVLLAAFVAITVLVLLRWEKSWDHPRTAHRQEVVEYWYGAQSFAATVECECPEYVIAGQTYKLNLAVTNRAIPNPGYLLQPSPMNGLTPAERALVPKYMKERATAKGRQEAIPAIKALSQAHPYDRELEADVEILNWWNTTNFEDRVHSTARLYEYIDFPLARDLLDVMAEDTAVELSVVNTENPTAAGRKTLKLDDGAESIQLSTKGGIKPSASAKLTLVVPKAPVSWTMKQVAPLPVGFSVGIISLDKPVWITQDASITDPGQYRNVFTFDVRNSFWLAATPWLAGLAALLALPLILAGVVAGARKLSSLNAERLLVEGRVGKCVGLLQCHRAKIIYLLVAAAWMGPWPGGLIDAWAYREQQTLLQFLVGAIPVMLNQWTRGAYQALLNYVFRFEEGFVFGRGSSSIYFGDNSFTVAFSFLFAALLCASLLSLKTTNGRIRSFLVTVVIPSMAIGYCGKDLYRYLLAFAWRYFNPQNFEGTSQQSHETFLLFSGLGVWLVCCAAVAVMFSRNGAPKTLNLAGWAIVLSSVSLLCLASGAYGRGYHSDGFYSETTALVLLPIYCLLGAGLIVFSGYPLMPVKRLHEAGQGHSVADVVQGLAMFAIPFCAFAILQMSHSESNAQDLVRLRQQFTEQTIDIRFRRPAPADAYLETDPSSGEYGKYLLRNLDPQSSAYDKSNELPPKPLGYFRPSGMKAMIEITQVEGKDGEYRLTSQEEAGPNWSETHQDGMRGPLGNPLQQISKVELDKLNKEEEELESKFQKDELKIVQESTSIPGTPIQLSGQYVSWCIVLISMAVLFMIHDRITLCEMSPLDASGAYLIWGNTIITKFFALAWPIWIAFSILVQIGGLVVITMLQASELPDQTSGVTLESVVSFTMLLALAAATPVITLSIMQSCTRIRRAIYQSTIIEAAGLGPAASTPEAPAISQPGTTIQP